MSATKVIDAIMRLTGEDLPEGESMLITKVPGGEIQVLRLAIRSSEVTAEFGDTRGTGESLKIEALILEGG